MYPNSLFHKLKYLKTKKNILDNNNNFILSL